MESGISEMDDMSLAYYEARLMIGQPVTSLLEIVNRDLYYLLNTERMSGG